MTKKRKLIASSDSRISIEQQSDDNRHQEYPYRNFNSLHTSIKTYQCAIGESSSESDTASKPCIPCAYKIATFDIALDNSFTQIVKNVRPEMCHRSNNKVGLEGTLGYYQNMNILTIGDGDFTFSLALARMLCVKDKLTKTMKMNKDEWKIIATSYESKDTLRKVYPNIDETITELESYQGQVKIEYQIDATRLSETLSPDVANMKFHRIIWNFPCTAERDGQDGQNNEMEENKLLIKKFVRNSVAFLKTKTSEIQMIHKTKPPYDQWNIEVVALEGWSESDNNDAYPLKFKGRIVFDKCLLPPYTPRKALDRKSFSCHDACTFIFGFDTSTNVGAKDDDFQPTITNSENEITSNTEEYKNESHVIIPVSKDIIDKIRKIHILHYMHSNRSKQKTNKRRRSNKNNNKVK